MDDQRIAIHVDRYTVECLRRATGLCERRDARGDADLIRAVDADLGEAGDPEIAGRSARREGRGEHDRSGNEEGAHGHTFHAYG